MTDFYTYMHCKPNGDPFYVGKGHGRRSHRFDKRNQHHKNIVAKYGAENILVYVTKRDSEESALKAEIRLIKMLRWAGFELCNQTDGGEGSSGRKLSAEEIARRTEKVLGQKRSVETCSKISAALKGVKKSAEFREMRSRLQRGKPSPRLGAEVSDETRRKQSEAAKARTGRVCSEETKAKIAKTVSEKAQARWAAKQAYDLRNKDGTFCHKPEKDGIVAHSDSSNVQL